MQNKKIKDVSLLKISEVFQSFNSGEAGLSKREAGKRLFKFGPNKLPEIKVDSWFKIFIRQFLSPLIYILLGAAVVVFFLKEWADGLVIVAVLSFNGIVGAIQEGKARNILLALKKLTKTNATVIRDGEEMIISDEKIVIGDLLIIREGEKISADARLVHSDALKVDESSFTGESNAVHKTEDAQKTTGHEISKVNMVFKGTVVVAGIGRAIVVATGKKTLIGNITEKMMSLEDRLPLRENINRLSRIILFVVGLLSATLVAINIYNGVGFRETFSVVVALAVSIIPEGLPIVVTLVLAKGVWAMSKQNVLIKKLQAVEALGQTKIIAVDKTGTITKNQLSINEIFIADKTFNLIGEDYDAKGAFFMEEKNIEPLNHKELILAAKIAALCSNAQLNFSQKDKTWKISGDPTEASTLVFSQRVGFSKAGLEKELKKIDEAPFDYVLKYHAALHQGEKGIFLSIIGAPEKIIDISTKIWNSDTKSINLDSGEKEKLLARFEQMSEKGLRVLAFGFSEEKMEKIPEKLGEITFVGFFGIKDNLREEVSEAVEKVRAAGIKLIMITGDYEITARSIAEDAGIFRAGDTCMNGEFIDQISEKKLAGLIENTTVFSRVTPSHKLKIINAFKLRGDVIAMTGDGVNDALPLAAADVGVGMGKIGTEVAKEASDIILTDDNFGSIVHGIEEGRNIYKTIKKVLLYLFSTSVAEAFVIIGALSLGYPLPILAVQILWLNLVTDGFLDVALAMDPKEDGLMQKKYVAGKWIIDKITSVRIITMALPMAIGTLFLFTEYYDNGLSKAWTVSLTALAVFQWFNAWNCRSEEKSIFRQNPFSNRYLAAATVVVIGLQFLAVYNPFMQKVLKTEALNLSDWVNIIAVAFSVIIIEEIRKIILSIYLKIKAISRIDLSKIYS